MGFSSARLDSHVLVVDSTTSRRQMLADVVRSLDFANVDLLTGGSDIEEALANTTPDWIILADHDESFTMRALQLIIETPRLRGTRVSVLAGSGSADHLALSACFENGLMSYHTSASVREQIELSLMSLITRLDLHAWNTTLVAAEYLREYLTVRRMDRSLTRLQATLLEMYPGSGRLLLQMAETAAMTGNIGLAHRTLQQALLISPRLEAQIDAVRRKISDEHDWDEPDSQPESTNVLGIDTCVLIDPDSAVQTGVDQMLRDAGVKNLVRFSDGDAAATWLAQNPEPSLVIMEWRIPKLAGPLLIQRIRDMGHITVPVIVASSLVGDGDWPLLQEMGVSAHLTKPFDQEAFFTHVVSTIQKHHSPTEYASYEIKIRSCLASGNLAEAQRLFDQCMTDSRIIASDRSALEAEICFHLGQYESARDLALEALKSQGDRLCTLDLLGKCFLKLGQPEVAVKCLDRAQSLSPLNVRRLCSLALIHAENGDLPNADARLTQAKNIDPESPTIAEAECKVALTTNDSDRIAASLTKVDALGRLLVYLNNRAVALARIGRFDEGIGLFRKTVDALPQPWTWKHDAVTYNLGLTLARYGNLGEAICQLRLIRGVDGDRVKRKAKSLIDRIEKASADGSPLVFHASKSSQAQPSTADHARIEIKRGDVCCYRIFRALESVDTVGVALGAKPNQPSPEERK